MAKSEELTHVLVPKHDKCSDKEKAELLERYDITIKQLPKISRKDPAIAHLDVESGDVIKITRTGSKDFISSAGISKFYRVVTDA